MQDIAIATGATYVAEEVGITLDSVTLVDIMLRTVLLNVSSVARKYETLSRMEAIEACIIQTGLEAENADTDFGKEKVNECIAALEGGIARVKVTSVATGTEFKDIRSYIIRMQ